MEKEFWLDRWKDNILRFHQADYNHLLVSHFDKLSLKQGERVFIPLCGKTLDMKYLLEKGHQIVGIEFSEIAIIDFFKELNIIPKILKKDKLIHYQADNIDLFVGDVFDLSSDIIGKVDAIYDRAAYVALPLKVRSQYANHLTLITQKALNLIITFEYDQNELAGPPFSISNDEIKQHYEKDYQIKLLESLEVDGGLKEVCFAKENIWLLKKR
jgi:thiopurine S-methyltransferase